MCINLCGELPKNVNNLRAFRDRVSLCMTETRHFVDHVPVFNDSIVYHESRWPITKQNERGGEEDASGESSNTCLFPRSVSRQENSTKVRQIDRQMRVLFSFHICTYCA